MTEPRDLFAEAQDGHMAGLPNGQAGPAADFRPSFPVPDAGPQPAALAAVREAIPPLPRNVPQAASIYPVTPPPPGNGYNGVTFPDEK